MVGRLLVTLLAVAITTPSATGEPRPAVLSEGQWSAWLEELGRVHAVSDGSDIQPGLAALGAKAKVAAEPSAAEQPALADYTIWKTRPRECWLTPGTSVHLRRVGDKLAAVISTNQGGTFVTVCASATISKNHVTFDRWVPWGPCKEAVICVRDKHPFLVPATSLDGAQINGVDISGADLRLSMPSIFDKSRPEARWAPMYIDAFRALVGVREAATDQYGFVTFRGRGGENYVALAPDLPLSDSVANAAAAQETQLRHLTRGQNQSTLAALALAGGDFNPAGVWRSGDGRSVLCIEPAGDNVFLVLELTDARYLRTSSASYNGGKLTAKGPLVTKGAKTLYACNIEDKQVLVADLFRTLEAWKQDPEGRAKLNGVWRRVVDLDPPAGKRPQQR